MRKHNLTGCGGQSSDCEMEVLYIPSKGSIQDSEFKVLYFYPAAFTSGCTIEAHDFAEAVEKYKALGATVVGVSHDPIDTLKRFSVSECRSKFAVVADTDGHIMKTYNSVMFLLPSYASRTSYVIAPIGEILYVYSSFSPGKHVENTLDALQKWVNAKH